MTEIIAAIGFTAGIAGLCAGVKALARSANQKPEEKKAANKEGPVRLS